MDELSTSDIIQIAIGCIAICIALIPCITNHFKEKDKMKNSVKKFKLCYHELCNLHQFKSGDRFWNEKVAVVAAGFISSVYQCGDKYLMEKYGLVIIPHKGNDQFQYNYGFTIFNKDWYFYCVASLHEKMGCQQELYIYDISDGVPGSITAREDERDDNKYEKLMHKFEEYLDSK